MKAKKIGTTVFLTPHQRKALARQRAVQDNSKTIRGFSRSEKKKIYAVYLAIFALPFPLPKKTTLLTALMGGTVWSWRVVGITPSALELLAENGYRYKKGNICRAHLVARIETARKVFERRRPFSESHFFNRFWENDKTVIATRAENRTNNGLPKKWIRINSDLGLFPSGLVSFRHGRKEVSHLRELHAKVLRRRRGAKHR